MTNPAATLTANDTPAAATLGAFDQELASLDAKIAEIEAAQAAEAPTARVLAFPAPPRRSDAGDLYEDGRNLRDTAKLVRREIKRAQVDRRLPRGKYSVTIQRYAGGQSINVWLDRLAEPCLVVNPARVRADAADPQGHVEELLYSEPGREILETLGNILGRFNRSAGTKHPHFFASVHFGGRIEREQRAHVLSIPAELRISARRWR